MFGNLTRYVGTFSRPIPETAAHPVGNAANVVLTKQFGDGGISEGLTPFRPGTPTRCCLIVPRPGGALPQPVGIEALDVPVRSSSLKPESSRFGTPN